MLQTIVFFFCNFIMVLILLQQRGCKMVFRTKQKGVLNVKKKMEHFLLYNNTMCLLEEKIWHYKTCDDLYF